MRPERHRVVGRCDDRGKRNGAGAARNGAALRAEEGGGGVSALIYDDKTKGFVGGRA